MERAQKDAFNAAARAERHNLDGVQVEVSGKSVSAVVAPPKISSVLQDGGDLLALDAQCQIRMEELVGVALRTGMRVKKGETIYEVLTITPDHLAGEWVFGLRKAP